MREISSILFVSFIITAIVGYNTNPNMSRIFGATTNLSASEVISVANAARQANQMSPLHPNPALMRAAEAKANAMLQANAWSHNTPTQTPWQFIDNEGYIYLVAGENLAKDFHKAEDVINAWLNSPSHRENLLNPDYTETGVAVVEGPFQNKQNTTLVVQYLAKSYVPGQEGDDNQFFSAPILENITTTENYLKIITGIIAVSLIATAFIIIPKLSKKKNHLSKPPHVSYWKH